MRSIRGAVIASWKLYPIPRSDGLKHGRWSNFWKPSRGQQIIQVRNPFPENLSFGFYNLPCSGFTRFVYVIDFELFWCSKKEFWKSVFSVNKYTYIQLSRLACRHSLHIFKYQQVVARGITSFQILLRSNLITMSFILSLKMNKELHLSLSDSITFELIKIGNTLWYPSSEIQSATLTPNLKQIC